MLLIHTSLSLLLRTHLLTLIECSFPNSCNCVFQVLPILSGTGISQSSFSFHTFWSNCLGSRSTGANNPNGSNTLLITWGIFLLVTVLLSPLFCKWKYYPSLFSKQVLLLLTYHHHIDLLL